MNQDSPAEAVRKARAGDRRALARAVSAVEDGSPGAPDLLRLFWDAAGGARRIGLTGAPGAGKSTLVSRLIEIIRRRGETAGVLAVDPSSPFTGGAILGDRIRMQEHIDDPQVYVRSLAGRGRLGGISAAAPKAAVILDGAGFDFLIIETVGVGQAEVDIMLEADTVTVVVTPGWGDGIQAGKAGLLEIGDVFAVNKADRPGADNARRDLEMMLDMGDAGGWRPPVVETAATDGTGMEKLWEALQGHAAHLREGELAARRLRRARAAVEEAVREAAVRRLGSGGIPGLEETAARVAAGETDPWTAAARLAG